MEHFTLYTVSWFADTELKSTGFTYIDDALPDEIKDFAFPEEVRKKMLLVTDQQVYEELHEMLMTDIKTPVQLVFRDSLCLDCGAQGDERLLDNYCHMDFQLIHPKNSILFHPEEKVPNFLILFLLKLVWAYSFSIGILPSLRLRSVPSWFASI